MLCNIFTHHAHHILFFVYCALYCSGVMAMMMNDFRNSQEQEFRDELAAGQPAHVSQNHQRKVLYYIN